MTSPTPPAWTDAQLPDADEPQQADQPARHARKGGVLRMILAGLLSVVLILGGVIGITAIVLYGDYSAQYPARFAAPARIGALVHTNEPALLAGEQAAVAELRQAGLSKPFAAFYDDRSDPERGVFVAGGTQRVLLPRFEVAGAFRTIEGSGITVKNLRRVNAGRLGGTVQCGTAVVEKVDAVICAWADHGSIGVVRMMRRSVRDAPGMVTEVRSAMIIRG
jgi:hypothetical protein